MCVVELMKGKMDKVSLHLKKVEVAFYLTSTRERSFRIENSWLVNYFRYYFRNKKTFVIYFG